MATTLGFQDVTFKSELMSLQRYLAALFPSAQVERTFREGVFGARPYMLINLVTADSERHSSWVSFPVVDYAVNYYAAGHADALSALEKFASLGRISRVPVFDYDTDEDNPTPLGYFLRISDVAVDKNPDLEDSTLEVVNLTFKAEGKRSLDKYTGETLAQVFFYDD